MEEYYKIFEVSYTNIKGSKSLRIVLKEIEDEDLQTSFKSSKAAKDYIKANVNSFEGIRITILPIYNCEL